MNTFEHNKPNGEHEPQAETPVLPTAEVSQPPAEIQPEAACQAADVPATKDAPVAEASAVTEDAPATEAAPITGKTPEATVSLDPAEAPAPLYSEASAGQDAEPPAQMTAGETAEASAIPAVPGPDEVFSAEACWAREEAAGDTFWHSTTTPDPIYRVRQEEPSSPYADSPFVSYEEAQRSGTTEQWRASFEDAPPAPKPKKKRKTRKSASRGLVAAALVFALLGSALGAIITGSVMNHRLEDTTAQLQSQLDELSQKGGGLVINSAGTPTGSGAISADGLMTPAQVYANNVSSVISVTTTGVVSNRWTTSQFTSTGSGFIISQDGYVLTNYHVIEGYTKVEITTIDEVTYEAQVVGYDAFSDVALLKVDAENLPCVIIGDSDAAAVGDMVAAIGNPLGELQSTQTVGYVSAKNRMVNTDGTILNMLQTDAAINSGNSGGPLFNMYGQVIGITTAKYSGSSSSGATIEGIGFAIPINAVMELIGDLMEHGYITNQAYMGVGLEEMDATIAQYYGLPTGPRVSSVEEGSAAQKAGIQEGDIIDILGDVDIASYSDLSYALRNYKAGDTTTVTVYRSGEFLELTITFDEKPAETATNGAVETPNESNGYMDINPWP